MFPLFTVFTRISNNEVKPTDCDVASTGRDVDVPQLTMSDKEKIMVLTSIAINLANPIKIPFIRLEQLDTHQVKLKYLT